MRNKWNDIPYVILLFIFGMIMIIAVFGCTEDKVVGNKINKDTVIFTIDTFQQPLNEEEVVCLAKD